MTDPSAIDDFALADEFALASTDAPALLPVLEAIDREGGRITFAEFMAIALGHPEHGYYSRPDLRWGRDGDYETSPEVHPIFGYLWARQVAECWERMGEPSTFALVEPGAGSGAFMAAILTWLRARHAACFAAVRPTLLDGSPHRLAQQRATLEPRGLTAEFALVDEWLSRSEPVTGVVISNEFFDALPVHLVERRGDGLVECYVGRGSGGSPLEFTRGDVSTPGIAAYFDRLGLLPGEDAQAEVGLAAVEVMRALTRRVERGYVITIDYGYEARELYASWRKQGTLMAFRRHSPQPDPLGQPGLTDLTYHVDFTSLAAAAEGWQAAPLTTQAEALTVLGLADALRIAGERASTNVQRYADERRAAETLTDMAGLGRISVLAMAKGAPLEGLRCLQPLESLFAR